jgi:hypothetical protein
VWIAKATDWRRHFQRGISRLFADNLKLLFPPDLLRRIVFETDMAEEGVGMLVVNQRLQAVNPVVDQVVLCDLSLVPNASLRIRL